MKKWTGIIFFISLHLPVVAQQQELYLRSFDYKQGLSNSTINCIFQDHLGFLWVGTDFGLNRSTGSILLPGTTIPAIPIHWCITRSSAYGRQAA
jgi:ligand-binding sensor domain-containing protein